MSGKVFIDAVISGEITDPDNAIHEYIGRWHESVEDLVPLHTFLGMTHKEYGLWLENPGTLKKIILYRKKAT